MNEVILVIDDDKKLCELLRQYLEKYEFRVIDSQLALEGFRMLEQEAVDLVILDVMLPQMDGFSACKKIRAQWDTPIIMLTARGELTDKVVGLEIGADDYLPKPFEPRELVARIQAVLRRKHFRGAKNKVLNFGDLRINPCKHSVTLSGKELNLTALEFDVLQLLTSNPGQVFKREQIQERIKGYELNSFERSIDVLISRLRQKLSDDPKNPRYIKTIWGTGYTFTEVPHDK